MSSNANIPSATPDSSQTAPTLPSLLWTYAYAYTAAHDFTVSDQIMTDDYALHMGTHALRGRIEQYQPATQRQYKQYPTLGFTVHRLVCNGDRASLHFTEHGRSIHGDKAASWQGVSLYRWNGARLTECRVEQDYYSRAHQLSTGEPRPVGSPGIDPWSDPVVPEDPSVLARAHDWLESGQWLSEPRLHWDDGTGRAQLEGATTTLLDAFSSGRTVAFHARVHGTYTGGLSGTDDLIGSTAQLYVTGIVDEGLGSAGSWHSGVLVSDRHSMLKRLHA